MTDLQFYLALGGAIVAGLLIGAAIALYISRNDEPIA